MVDLPLIGCTKIHVKVAEQFRLAFLEMKIRKWDKKQGRFPPVLDVADTRDEGGCYNCRTKKRTDGRKSHEWSVHAYGAAFDINPSRIPFGEAWTDIAPMYRKRQDMIRNVMELYGFAWLPHDRMHFQPYRILSGARRRLLRLRLHWMALRAK